MYHWLQPAYINRKCIVIVQLFFVERTPTKFVLDEAAALLVFFPCFTPIFAVSYYSLRMSLFIRVTYSVILDRMYYTTLRVF